MLDKVIFGDACFGRPSVLSVEITDGLEGWDTRQMMLCLSPKAGMPQVCKFLSETYSDISKAIPIDQNKVEKYAEEERP